MASYMAAIGTCALYLPRLFLQLLPFKRHCVLLFRVRGNRRRFVYVFPCPAVARRALASMEEAEGPPLLQHFTRRNDPNAAIHLLLFKNNFLWYIKPIAYSSEAL